MPGITLVVREGDPAPNLIDPPFGPVGDEVFGSVLNAAHILADGRIVKSGDKTLALELEEKGYSFLEAAAGSAK